jgi:predicted MFS family arabinose efflux permease
LTLAEVPVEMGGVAGSMGQVGQRAGTAIGSAGAGLAAYHEAYRNGFLVVLALVTVALVLAVLDLRARKTGRVASYSTD